VSGVAFRSYEMFCPLRSERYALHRLPFFQHFAVARFPIPQIREYGNGRLQTQDDCRVVREINVRAEIISGHVNLNALDDLAFGLWKFGGSCAFLWRLVTILSSHDVRSMCIVIRGA